MTGPRRFAAFGLWALALCALALLGSPPPGAAQQQGTAGGPPSAVIGLSFRGQHRAYPLEVFAAPRVINDRIRHQEIAIYHDPDREYSAAYFRLVLGEAIEFSGRLNGTLAEDMTTVTRWDMTSGKAVAGNLIGMELVPLPVVTTSLAEWISSHPDTTIYPAEGP